MIDIRSVNFFPKQVEFMEATERMVLFCGGTGSGKSHALIYKLLRRASKPGAREGLVRKINADINTSFLKDWKSMVPSSLYTHNVNQQIIAIKGGGEIQMFGCDDPERIGSRQLTGCAIEEAVQLAENDWQKINSVVRLHHPMGNQMYAVCNPDSTEHWMYDYFQVDRPTPKNRRYIPVTVEDGYLGQNPEYLAAMKEKTGIDRKRRYEGLWCDATGAVFDNFSEANVCDRVLSGKVVLGIDDGDSAPFVVHRAVCDGFNLHIEREFYKKNVRSLDSKTEIVQRMYKECKETPFAVVVDNQAVHVIEALWKVGLPAIKSKKGNHSVEAGVSKIGTMLSAPGAGGKPRLTISPSCAQTIREFKSWAYMPSGEYGRNNNHALDDIRYLVSFFDLGSSMSAEQAQEQAEIADDSEALRQSNFTWEGESVNIFGETAWA